MTTLDALLADRDFTVTLSAEPTPYLPKWATPGSHSYIVKLFYDDAREMEVIYTMGPAITGTPDVRNVMETLLSDAATLDGTRDFDQWARELGYDAMPQTLDKWQDAQRTYREVVRQTANLQALLGADYNTWRNAE